MRVTKHFSPYNTRRYGRPWIAKVSAWPIGKQPTLEFGGNIGLMCEIEADPGTIVRWGLRDNRGGRHTVNAWAIVGADGGLIDTTPEDAREHWLRGCPVASETDGSNVVPFKAEG